MGKSRKYHEKPLGHKSLAGQKPLELKPLSLLLHKYTLSIPTQVNFNQT